MINFLSFLSSKHESKFCFQFYYYEKLFSLKNSLQSSHTLEYKNSQKAVSINIWGNGWFIPVYILYLQRNKLNWMFSVCYKIEELCLLRAKILQNRSQRRNSVVFIISLVVWRSAWGSGESSSVGGLCYFGGRWWVLCGGTRSWPQWYISGMLPWADFRHQNEDSGMWLGWCSAKTMSRDHKLFRCGWQLSG